MTYDELGNFRSDIKNLHELCNYLKLYIDTAKKSLFVDNNYSEAQYHLAKFIGTYIAYKQMLNIIYEDDTFNVEWVHEIEEIIEANGQGLVESYKLFDVYTGSQIADGYKSVAYSITYRSKDKTLTDEDVAKVHDKILSELETKLDAKLRTN